jgi:hypothetical protein
VGQGGVEPPTLGFSVRFFIPSSIFHRISLYIIPYLN